MADLDDFFAKKDRKKAKGKKFTTTEEIAKKLEETGKKVDKNKLKDKAQNAEGGDDNQPAVEEDEWKEFEEEKKDYSGLKIGNLSVTESVYNNTDDDKTTGENNSDGEGGDGDNKNSPWKKSDAAPEPEVVAPPPAAAPAPVVTAPTSGGGGGSYKHPHFKTGLQLSSQHTRPMGHLRRNVAPDINSEEYFPTLNAKQPVANDSSGAWGRKRREEGNFEEVRNRGGTRTYNTPDSQAPNLSLGNKYGALPQDQS